MMDPRDYLGKTPAHAMKEDAHKQADAAPPTTSKPIHLTSFDASFISPPLSEEDKKQAERICQEEMFKLVRAHRGVLSMSAKARTPFMAMQEDANRIATERKGLRR